MSNSIKIEEKQSLEQFRLEIANSGQLHNDELARLFASLFRLLTPIHEENKVANLWDVTKIQVLKQELVIDVSQKFDALLNRSKLNKITQNHHGIFEVTERIIENTTVGTGELEFKSKELSDHEEVSIESPCYLLNYKSYEQEIGHYDQKTELFVCGMLMASFAFSLDFGKQEDLEKFVHNRKQLYYLNRDLHPTLIQIITQLTELDRSKRTGETLSIIWKLDNYKDYSTESEDDITLTEGFNLQKTNTRNSWVLQKLKSRLFELSRRNKLLYFQPANRFLNLTIGSVPTVLYYENVKEKDLFLWNDDISKKIINQDKINLSKYLQLDEAGYISSNLDQIRTEARKDIYEYGFSQLKLVLTFLNWYNFKENKSEKISSPLLILPVSLNKKKGVKDTYELEPMSNEAEINPVLAHYLKDLYDIDLPESIDLEKVDLKDFYEKLNSIISAGNKEIQLTLYDKPRIKLIQSIAKQKINQHQKHTRYRTQEFNISQFNYSYKKESYTPLGCQIYRNLVQPHSSMLEYLINDDIKLQQNAFSEVKTRDLYSLDSSGEQNPYVWEYDMCNMTLGNFNYKKMSLVSDYTTILESDGDNPVFSKLFSDEPKKLKDENENIGSYEDNFYVLNADATQGYAISKAQSGDSFIIQGPPGTGKSQTITNLIADFASRGKKVLFVCEKRAALDVVYARLKQRNIHHLASLIHDSQTNKKEFILDVKSTYEKFIKEEDHFLKLKGQREEKIKSLKLELSKINQYHQTLRKSFETIGVNFIEFIEHIIFLRNKTVLDVNSMDLNGLKNLDYATWKSASVVLGDFSKALSSLGYTSNPGEYSLKRVSKELLHSNQAVQDLSDTVVSMLDITSEWTELAEMSDLDEITKLKLEKLKVYCQYAGIVLGLSKNAKTDVLNSSSSQAQEFDVLKVEIKKVAEELELIKKTNQHWNNKLSKEELIVALETVENLEGKFYSFLIPSFNKVKKIVKSSYDFSAHQLAPKMSSVLKNLSDEYQKEHNKALIDKKIGEEYGLNALAHSSELIEQLRTSAKTERELLVSKNKDALKTLAEIEAELVRVKDDLNLIWKDNEEETITSLDTALKQMDADIKTFPVVLPYLKAFNELPETVQNLIQKSNDSLETNELKVAEATLLKLYKENILVVNATGYSLNYSIDQIKRLHKELLELNGNYLVEQYKTKFKQQLKNSELLAKDQTEQDKIDKKEFLKSRRVLENEFNKSIRFKSIRELKSKESDHILDIIKPIWLMSPLSVSDTLPVDSNQFDVVIFDEASQITLEEGVPTLFRSKQAIIVGDEMQMPPTNFFTASSSAKEEIEDQDSEDKLVIDADSMLTHASKKLEDVMLSWHYRSQYEGLIGFSNSAFYAGNLLTIPDQEVLKLNPDTEEDKSITQRLNEEVISYHFQEDGVYSKRKNNVEAAYVADMLKTLLIEKPELSIGIVAFSKEQQENIENTIDALAAKDKVFAELLENAYNRTEDGQQVGLFVKNLENVQGDERDIIIISICYGYDEKGKMLMNFGPINRKGGEKRLNVIFSRSKKHMAIVASIHYNDIKNEYNEGANYFRRFLQYSQNMSEGNEALASDILRSLASNEQDHLHLDPKKDGVLSEICQYLESLNYAYEANLGLSKFKISIGVKDPENHLRFKLGILLDSTSYYETQDILDSYVLRPSLLDAFGWQNITIYKKDWLDRPDLVKERLKLVLSGKQELITIVQEERLAEQTSVSEIIELTPNVEEVKIDEISEENEELTHLTFKDDVSDKFWEVKQNGFDLMIRFGRSGTNGRDMVKSFESESQAELEMNKLINEKLKKGYLSC